jgi:hypothetical protein
MSESGGTLMSHTCRAIAASTTGGWRVLAPDTEQYRRLRRT